MQIFNFGYIYYLFKFKRLEGLPKANPAIVKINIQFTEIHFTIDLIFDFESSQKSM